MKRFFHGLRTALTQIGMVDWFLILFMAVLLGHTVLILFFGAQSQEASPVDIIVRTSAAAIFGYFLSQNSMQSSSETSAPPPSSLLGGGEPGITGRIGFSLSETNPKLLSGGAASSSNGNACPNFQVGIVASIGLLSLGLLIFMREHISASPSMTAAASQLRDFVSASVGFLVSCGNNRKK